MHMVTQAYRHYGHSCVVFLQVLICLRVLWSRPAWMDLLFNTAVTWQSSAGIIPQALMSAHLRGGEGVGEINLEWECNRNVLCANVRVRFGGTVNVSNNTEHWRANVNTCCLTPKPKHRTATAGPPLPSKRQPLNYFFQEWCGFLLNHSGRVIQSPSGYENGF